MPMGGDVWKFIRSLNGSVTIDCREDDVSELFIYPVQIVPIRVCQLFGCYNLRFSVRNDQNAPMILPGIESVLDDSIGNLLGPSA